VPYTAKFKFVPKLRLQDGFVRNGGVFLKKDWFNKNQADSRVSKTFDFPRLDRLREDAERNADPWRWKDFRAAQLSSDPKSPFFGQEFLDFFAEPELYTFYVRGRWEGITGKRVVSTSLGGIGSVAWVNDKTDYDGYADG
jgi:hypothetical protein